MLYSYGVSVRGEYHKKDGSACQDAHRIIKVSDNLVIAAVADGLGSSLHSDIASKTAVEVSCEYCASRIEKNEQEEGSILGLLKDAFNVAYEAILKIVEESGDDPIQYDTTLSLSIVMDDELYCGQAGDSGIIALTKEGLYVPVTKQQRDEYGGVYPICMKDSWQFFRYEEPVASVLLASDGMLDPLFPVLLINQETKIFIDLAEFLMNIERTHIVEDGEKATEDRIRNYIERMPGDIVDDDKTVVAIMSDDKNVSRQPDSYYSIPDWDKLQKERDEMWMREAYPDREVEKDDSNTSSIDEGTYESAEMGFE